MDTLSVAVYGKAGIPERDAGAQRVLKALAPLDPIHVPDHAHINLWTAARAAWKVLLATGSDWLVVFQDDVIPCAHLGDDLPLVLAHAPATFLALYCPRKSMVEAAKGTPWVNCPGGIWGQCVAFRREELDRFLAWDKKTFPSEYHLDDRRYSLYAFVHEIPLAFAIPGLVDHDLTIKSTLGIPPVIAGRYKRCAASWLGDQRPASMSWQAADPLPRAPDGLSKQLKEMIRSYRETGEVVL